MFDFEVNGVPMSLDLYKMRLHDRCQIFKLNVAPAQINGRVYFKLTSSCNLSCIYCFQKDDIKKPQQVDISDFKLAVQNCLNSSNTDFYIFLDSQYENVQYLLNNSGVSFYVFTNGCFSTRYRNLISQFRNRLKLIITLDGTKEIHNQRRRKNSSGSFDEIIDNIDFLQTTNANWLCQINIDDDNYSNINHLFAFLDSKYHINEIDTVLNPVLHCNVSKADLSLLQKYVELDSIYHLKRCIVNCKTARKLSALLSGRGVDKRRCDIENSYVLDFESKTVYCCPESSTSLIGTIDVDGIHIDKHNCAYMFDLNQKRNRPCKRCEYNMICGYGCFLDEIDYTCCKQEIETAVLYFFEHANHFLRIVD